MRCCRPRHHNDASPVGLTKARLQSPKRHAVVLDGFEIKRDSNQTVRATNMQRLLRLGNPDLSGLGRRGLPGESEREMFSVAVEKRFGDVEGISETHALELVSDNGDTPIAPKTRQIARRWAGRRSIHPCAVRKATG